MWRSVDASLGLAAAVNLAMMMFFATPPDSPLKNPAMKAAYVIVTRIPHQFNGAVLLYLLSVAAVSAKKRMAVRFGSACYTFVLNVILMRMCDILRKLGPERIMEIEHEVEEHDIRHFSPPSRKIIETLLRPMEALMQTECLGLENVPRDYPCFWVMNHSLLGIEMAPFWHAVYMKTGIFLRGLGHHIHFIGPQGSILRRLGAVDGTRRNLDVLMEMRENVAVYPGGAEELFKRKDSDRYALMWKEKLGFARMAIKHRYPILPCAAVGVEDMLRPVADTPILPFCGNVSLPIVSTTPGRLQKIYFWFGKPIPTEHYGGDHENTDYARELRDKVKEAVEVGIRETRVKQESDPDRYYADQLTRKFSLSSLHEPKPQSLKEALQR